MESPEVQRRWVVSPEELPELSKTRTARIIDTRRASLYAKSHIKEALSLPLSGLLSWAGQAARFPPRNEIENLMTSMGVSTNDCMVLYDDHQGQHASRVAWTLEHSGYWNVSVLDMDFSKVGKVELAPPPPGEEKAAPKKSRATENIVTTEELISTLNKGDSRIIDCREPNLFPVGHIPGAASLPWYLLSGHGRNFLSPEEIQINTMKLQLEGRQTIVYCSSGLNSAHTYVALRAAGLKNVKVYAATFGEWLGSGATVERGWQTPETKAEPVP